MQTDIVILAAGEGRRLRSAMPKPLQVVGDRSMLAHVLMTAGQLKPRTLVVVTPPDSPVAAAVALVPSAVCAVQKTPRGTADALRCALSHLKNDGVTIVLSADTPLLQPASLRQLRAIGVKGQLALLTFETEKLGVYGRVLPARSATGDARCIVEARDGGDQYAETNKTVYAGVMAAPTRLLKQYLVKINDNNAAGERYLTDIVAMLAESGTPVKTVSGLEEECAGVNTAVELEAAERFYQRRRARTLMESGVRLADSARLDIRGHIKCGRDVEIDVNVILAGEVTLADHCRIGAHCILRDCVIGKNTRIEPFSHIDGTRIGADCRIGPYARLRPGSALAAQVQIGNFVEVKNSRLQKAVKVNHLAYLGDTDIGGASNVGAGVITCNYDGRKKHKTIIGAGVFIGSDTQLVAPVKIGYGAYIGSGTTVTENVQPRTLVLSRAPQTARPLRATQQLKRRKNT